MKGASAMTPANKQPLFIITGASCAGKSAVCAELFKNEKDYIVMEGDLLWQDVYNTPEDDYREYRKLWMRVCANISQIGIPVVLCGCTLPEQFEYQTERVLFTDVHYLAVVCDDGALEKRMRGGRGVTDESWIKSSADFNRWLKANADKTVPEITLLDTTNKTPSEAAAAVHTWILKKLQGERS